MKANYLLIFFFLFLVSGCSRRPASELTIANNKGSADSIANWLDTLGKLHYPQSATQRNVNDLAYFADTTIMTERRFGEQIKRALPAYFDLDPVFINIFFTENINGATLRLPHVSFTTAGDDGDTQNIFHHDINFSNNEFREFLHIPGYDKADSGYHTNSIISNSIFQGNVQFLDNRYICPLNFSNVVFDGLVKFSNSYYGDAPDSINAPQFFATELKKGVKFVGNTSNMFRGPDWKFLTNLSFDNCRISGAIDLSGCSFLGNSRLILEGTRLPDTLNLQGTHLGGPLDLTNTRAAGTGRVCEINLLNTDVDKIKMIYSNFHLYFPDHMADSVQYRDQVSSTYQNLLANFKKNGFDDSYRQLDIEFKDWQSRSDYFTRLDQIWWRYGYEKTRILGWVVLFVMVFGLLNSFFYKSLMETYTINELKSDMYVPSRYYTLRMLQRYGISCLYTSFIFFKLSLDFDKLKVKNLKMLFLILLQYGIGLICTAYLLNWIISK